MTGIVIQQLRPERCPEAVGAWRWLRVRTTQGMVVAADGLNAGIGEQVLLVSGDTARNFVPDCPGDWCVAGILNPEGK